MPIVFNPVAQIFNGWNRINGWLRRVDGELHDRRPGLAACADEDTVLPGELVRTP